MAKRRPYQGAHDAAIPIEAITTEVAAWSDDIVKAVADELLKETRKNARSAFADKSGKLRKSIRKKKSKFGESMMIVQASMPHAHLVEQGHDVKVRKDGRVLGHAPARPFLGPAAETVRSRLPEIINNVVGPITIEVKS
ncbi:HK97 gp10 family phage protein [Desulfovibrio sp. OttesenSCG-928-G11]|nr:HK97 gp10 family phage protein [Desulfovibrio sp. OttesenSCG-928-G11]